MKAQVKVGPSIIVDVEEVKQKDLFKAIASAHEVFGEKCCGLCKSTNIIPSWRINSVQDGKKFRDDEYPEFRCKDCGAVLSLGTKNDGKDTLFPKRKLLPNGQPAPKARKREAEYGPHNGWYKLERKDAAEPDEKE